MNKGSMCSFLARLLVAACLLLGLGDCTTPYIVTQTPWETQEYHPWGVSDSVVCDCGNQMCRCPGIFHSIYVGGAPPNPRFSYTYISCIGAAPPPGYSPTLGWLRARCPYLESSS